ncbi:MAG: GNAT family N-acetyltransferase [Candidatus Paceibacterota bacterium]|jgi:GNAT superfamily N-acetyltransferase
MNKLVIRVYTVADLEQIINLHNIALEATGAHVGNGHWDRDLWDIENIYLKNNGTFLIGSLQGQIVAMGALRRISEEMGEIKRMRVLPQFQRQGFGQAILTALETDAAKRGYKLLCLDTTVLQVASQKMYLKNGYTETKRTKEGFPFETIFYEKRLSA